MAYEPRTILMELARLGALEHQVDISTGALSEALGTSQQTASLYLIRMASDGYIDRTMKRYGSLVRITEMGLDLLYDTYTSLFQMFGRSRTRVLRCKVSSGLGEGAYYLAQRGYIEQVADKLGFVPFPGTLNLELSMHDAPFLDLLRKGPGIQINSFESEGRTFGSCLCYHSEIEGVMSAVMVPIRTIHKRTLEIISPERLRTCIGLEDGSSVEIKVRYHGVEPFPGNPS